MGRYGTLSTALLGAEAKRSEIEQRLYRRVLSERIEVTTKDRLAALNGTAQPNIIARTSSHIFYRPDQPTLALIDFDTKGMPPASRVKMDQLGGFLPALMSVLPELVTAARAEIAKLKG